MACPIPQGGHNKINYDYEMCATAFNLPLPALNILCSACVFMLIIYLPCNVFADLHSIAEQGGCFQWRLFVSLFVNMIISEQLNAA